MRADDLRAVLDAVGSESAILLGVSEGVALSAFFPDPLGMTEPRPSAGRRFGASPPTYTPVQCDPAWGSPESGLGRVAQNPERLIVKTQSTSGVIERAAEAAAVCSVCGGAGVGVGPGNGVSG